MRTLREFRRAAATPAAAAPLTLFAMASAGGVWWLSITHAWPIIGDCWFRLVTGWPCPGCGMGRAFLALLRGQWRLAVALHPLSVPFAVALLVGVGWLVRDTSRGIATFYAALHAATARPVVRAVLVSTMAAVWCWNLWRNGA